jgi:hypothetical protein
VRGPTSGVCPERKNGAPVTFTRRAITLAIILSAASLHRAGAEEIVVRARYLGPVCDTTSYQCSYMQVGTLTKYDSVDILAGALAKGPLFVVHPCMEIPRQRYSVSAGNLRSFRVRETHILFLTSTGNVQMVVGRTSGPMYYCTRVDSAPNDIARLPAGVRVALDNFFPGWRMLPVRPEAYAAVARAQAGASPLVATGDFDGDSVEDVAVQVLIQYADMRSGIVVAALKRPERYSIVKVDSACDYVLTRRKGSEVAVGETKVKLELDGLGACRLDGSDEAAYRMEKGMFQRIGAAR